MGRWELGQPRKRWFPSSAPSPATRLTSLTPNSSALCPAARRPRQCRQHGEVSPAEPGANCLPVDVKDKLRWCSRLTQYVPGAYGCQQLARVNMAPQPPLDCPGRSCGPRSYANGFSRAQGPAAAQSNFGSLAAAIAGRHPGRDRLSPTAPRLCLRTISDQLTAKSSTGGDAKNAVIMDLRRRAHQRHSAILGCSMSQVNGEPATGPFASDVQVLRGCSGRGIADRSGVRTSFSHGRGPTFA